MGLSKKHITAGLYGLLAGIAIAFLVFEWKNMNSNLDEIASEANAISAVEESFNQLSTYIFDFSSNSTEFANLIEQQFQNSEDQISQVSGSNQFWGFTVFQEGTPVLWDGFTSTTILDSLEAINSNIKLERRRTGNVQFLESTIPVLIDHDSDTTYLQVVTRALIEQKNESDIGKNFNFTPEEAFNSKSSYPVRIAFSRVENDSVIHSREFESISGDFIATVYGSTSDSESFQKSERQKISTYRSYFITAIVVMFSILILWLTTSLHPYLRLFIHLGIFSTLYFFEQSTIQHQQLAIFIQDLGPIIFSALLYSSLFIAVKGRIASLSDAPSSEHFILSFLSGLSTSIWIMFLLILVDESIGEAQINVFNQILTSSNISTIWLFFVSGTLATVLMLSNRIFLLLSHQKGKLNFSLFSTILIGATVPLIISFFLKMEIDVSNSILGAALFISLIICLSTFIQAKFSLLRFEVSLLRAFLIINTVAGLAVTSVIYSSFSNHLYSQLELKTNEFLEDNEDQIEAVISDLLFEAYGEVRSISLYSVSNFEQIIEGLIKDEWLKYSFSVQLIDNRGGPLAAYNTNLSVPQWTTDYRVDELIIPYEEEQIRRDNIRPILRERPINTVNAEYSYFMRGWIPVYQSRRSDNITGWILATLYKEIPELNRPFRSVVNATIQSPEETAFSLTEYRDLLPARSTVSGTLSSLPDYGVIPQRVSASLSTDSLFLNEATIQGVNLKEQFTLTEDGNIVRAAHQAISNTQVLYVFLRIYFTVAIPFILMLLLIFSSKKWLHFSESRRIRDRLMDRFIIASIVCLFLLIGATSFILENQNRDDVEESLREQLKTLTDTIREASESEQSSNDYLENLTSVLGVDASLFKNGRLINSTTPPIYNQHLVSSVVPWDVFQNITTEGSQLAIDILNIDGQELMVGYQPWLDENNQIAGIAAIPTFLKTPDFYNGLLTTTSYLLAFYSLIFGILVISIGVIATRITSPLETLEKGLAKISAGNLDTRIEVLSNDEIGLLTVAYNTMASRLKTLQDELAQTEREAAWKEMAQQVAHEIKNPLTPMKLNLQHLERQLNQTNDELSVDRPRVAAITKSMIEQIEALNKIASDFSKFARPSKQSFEEVKINELVQSVAALYQEDDSRISLNFDSREFIIPGVQDELRRVLVNLIKNAQEAIPEDGFIKISTQWNKTNKCVEIRIQDNGEGISEEEAKQIFMPNFSTKTSGTGLGLAITKKIIEEHSGTITFESSKGKGTTFIIDLPLK